MSLPRSGRRVYIIVLRSAPADPEVVDEWNRPVRTVDPLAPDDPPEVLRTIGDLQPLRTRGGTGETPETHLAGANLSAHIAFTDVLDIRTGDIIRTTALADPDGDDGLRYNVTAVRRPGRGRRLDHLEVLTDLVGSGVQSTIDVGITGSGS